jgi:hypothetical protein
MTTPSSGHVQLPARLCPDGGPDRGHCRLWTDELRVVSTGMCLDVNANSTADGAALIQWPCSGQSNQRWRLTVS